MTLELKAEIIGRLRAKKKDCGYLIEHIHYTPKYVYDALTVGYNIPKVEDAICELLDIDREAVTTEPMVCKSIEDIIYEINKQKTLKGLTNKQLSKMTGVNAATISRTRNFCNEHCGYYISVNMYRKVADALGIPHDIKTEKELSL